MLLEWLDVPQSRPDRVFLYLHGGGYCIGSLDSHRSMAMAHEIYKNAGFNVVDAPTDFPPALRQSVVFMRCVL